MFNPLHSLIRTLAFMNKEVLEIFRQPRLLVTLVMGPFLILFLFGIGYRSEGPPLRTLFVVEPNDPIEEAITQYVSQFEPQITFEGVTHDFSKASKRLRKGDIDLVVKAPANAYHTIKNNQQAHFLLYHNEIDPYQADYIEFTGELYVNKLNRLILGTVLQQAKTGVSSFSNDLNGSKAVLAHLQRSLEKGDWQQAERARQIFLERSKILEDKLSSQVRSIQEESGIPESEGLEEFIANIQNFRKQIETKQFSREEAEARKQSEQVGEMVDHMSVMETQLKEIVQMDGSVLFSPFRSTTQGLIRKQPNLSEYFTPSVIILLLQHLAVTFSALSIVRELRAGTTELLRISPMMPSELLVGKYLGYFLIGIFVTTVLTVLVVYLLRIPMLGSWLAYGLVITTVLFASLGVGFVLSLLAQTESQAVQYSMMVLLISIFFTGFLMNLKMLWSPARLVSWALPATYGIEMLQNVMLRGAEPVPKFLIILCVFGILLFVTASRLLRRRMAQT